MRIGPWAFALLLLFTGPSVLEAQTAPSPQETMITADSRSIPADGSTTTEITVQLRDADGEVVEEAGHSVTLATALGSLSAVTDNGDGTYTATLTAPSEPGVAIVRGELNGEEIVDDAPVIFRDLGTRARR